ncbi:MAG: NUDIX domain-containing protein [Pseudomonadota bacterium]|nr:NUDIX domain-containing protein [Pseudomonadota bacterium]
MLRLIPPPAHRLALRLAHAVRKRWWRLTRPTLESCAVIACDIEGRLLLVRLSYGTGNWSLPIGGVKRREAPEEAARRELREETGVEAHAMALLGVRNEELHGAVHRLHIFATQVAGHPRPDRREVLEARFFPPHSLPEPLDERTRLKIALWRQRS